MKRKLVILAILLVGILGAWFFWPRDNISTGAFQQIRLGMNLAEVEAIMGEPGLSLDVMVTKLMTEGRKFLSPDIILHEGNDWSKGKRPDVTKIMCWQGNSGGISVQVDNDGRVIGKHFEGRNVANFLDRVWERLGW